MRHASLILLLAAASIGCTAAESSGRTRVVLITLDTLRYDRFEGTLEQPSAMPRTRAHARDGLVFRRCYAVSGVTQPVHATLFSGLQPWHHGVTRNGVVLPKSLPNIVEIFSNEGYETRAVVASFPLTRRFGFARGFDVFTQDFSHNLNQNKTLWEGHWKIEAGAFFAMADTVNRHAIEAIEQASAEKQFFWFHYFDPHAPYGASSGGKVIRKRDILEGAERGPDEATRQLDLARQRYDADVRTLDRALDKLLRRLDEDAARYETHILVVADHGESLGEGGSVGHGARLNEAELRIPAFILSPRVRSGVSDQVVGTIDLAPTLLALGGIEVASPTFEGRDLTAPLAEIRRAFAIRRTAREPDQAEQRLDGKQYPLADVLFAAVDANGEIRRGNRKGLLTADASADATAITRRFSAFEDALDQLQDAEPLTPEVRRGLEALGYVD